MRCPFVAEQHVVCIMENWVSWTRLDSGVWVPGSVTQPAPANNQVVKIRVIELLETVVLNGEAPVMLHLYGFPGRWQADGFRPLQDRPSEADTDISQFLDLANSAGPWAPPISAPEGPQRTAPLVPQRENAWDPERPRFYNCRCSLTWPPRLDL